MRSHSIFDLYAVVGIMVGLVAHYAPMLPDLANDRAELEAGVNAVAIFYPNRTYRLHAWDDLRPLQIHRRHVAIAVYHVQSPTPGSLPNTVMFTEHSMYCLKHAPAQGKLIMRALDFPPVSPENAFEFTFDENDFTQDFSGTLRNPAVAAAGGMTICTRTLNPNAPNYQTLADTANGFSVSLRDDPVPSTGTY